MAVCLLPGAVRVRTSYLCGDVSTRVVGCTCLVAFVPTQYICVSTGEAVYTRV